MFKAGDTVLYGNGGVCTITEITERNFDDKVVEYFVLKPVFDKRSAFFVPTGNENLLGKMHPVLNVEQLAEVVRTSEEFESWIDNDSRRRDFFRDVLSSGEIDGVVSLAKTVIRHRQEAEACGKKLHKADEAVLKEAQKILYEEIALVAQIGKDDIEDVLCGKKDILG